jgi:hypothetical protein
MHISFVLVYEHKHEEYFALGMRDGSLVLKQTGSVLNASVFAHVVPPRDLDDTSMADVSVETSQEDDRVTCIRYMTPGVIAFGSKEGRLSFYDLNK